MMYDTVVEANGQLATVMNTLVARVIKAIEDNRTEISVGDDDIARSAANGNNAHKRRTGKPLIT